MAQKFGWLMIACAQLCYAHADDTFQSTGELLEIRLEGEGVAHPVRLELALPTQGMASKVVGPLSQSVANALRQCKGLGELIQQTDTGLQINLTFEKGLLSKARAHAMDEKGALGCALKKVEAARVSTFPLNATEVKGVLRIRHSEG